jgi:hypothetical protein
LLTVKKVLTRFGIKVRMCVPKYEKNKYNKIKQKKKKKLSLVMSWCQNVWLKFVASYQSCFWWWLDVWINAWMLVKPGLRDC